MKYKKLFGALLVASTLVLGACGGNGSNSGNKSTAKPSGSGNTPTSRSSIPPQPSVDISELAIAKDGNDVFLSVKGSVTAIDAASLKFAFGLEIYSSSSSQAAEGEGEGEGEATPADNFVYGKATPADADYNVDAPIADKKFEAKLNLSSLKNAEGKYLLEGGNKYAIYAGAKGYAYEQLELDAPTTVLQDNAFKYYFRADQEAGNSAKLVVDDLGPVRIEKVSVARDLYGRTGIFAKIGGANNANLTEEQLNGYTSYVNFQKLPNTSTRVQKEGSQTEGNPYYFYKVEGEEAFIIINIDFMVRDGATSGDYNTHLNIQQNKQENCVSTGVIDTTDAPFDAGNGKTIAVYSHPGEHKEENIWGNVGFRVTIPEAEEAGEQDLDLQNQIIGLGQPSPLLCFLTLSVMILT